MDLPPSRTGWLALYRSRAEDEAKTHRRYLAVDGWGPDGEALVVDQEAGRRVPAGTLPHFRGLQETEAGVAGVVPGQGWSLVYGDGGGPDVIVAWIVDHAGFAAPVVAATESFTEVYEVKPGDYFVPPGVDPEDSPYRPRRRVVVRGRVARD